MPDTPYVHLIDSGPEGIDAISALELTGLGFSTSKEDMVYALRRQAELLGSLVDLRDHRWFELDYIGEPWPEEPWRSRARIALLLGSRHADRSAAVARGLELHQSVRVALPHDTGLYEFQDVITRDTLEALWEPFVVRRRVEMTRRLEWVASGAAVLVHAFDGFSPEFGALPRALLSSPDRARVRFAFRPTRLFPWEEAALLRVLEKARQAGTDPELLRPLPALARARDQLLLVRVLVESEGDPPAGVFVALAADVAGAGHDGRGDRREPLSGAFDLDPLPIAGPRDLPLPDHRPPDIPQGMPDGLERLRYLFSVDDAARLFRLPLLQQPIFGLPSRRSRTLPAPPEIPASGLLLGRNGRATSARPIAIPDEARDRHLYVLGQTGTGKSTLLHSLIMRDIRAGRGVCLIDPHGDLVERVMATMPEERLQDVALLDPTDSLCPVGMNFLDLETDIERDRMIEGFLALFEHMWPPEFVGPIFQHMVRSTLQLMMRVGVEGIVPHRPTIMSLPRYMRDKALLKVLQTRIKDPTIQGTISDVLGTDERYRSDNVTWVISKFNVLLSHSQIKSIVGQHHTRLDLEEVLDQGKILLIRLPSGQLGELTARFLGFLMLSKLQNLILKRAERPREQRRQFYLYVDEFQNFLTESFTVLLAEGRKFGVNMVLANQFLGQLEDQKIRHRILGAIFGNVGTIVSFRVGHEDASEVALQFGEAVTPHDLTALPNFSAYVRLLSSRGAPLAMSLETTIDQTPADPLMAERCRQHSRKTYGMPFEEIQAGIEFESMALTALSKGVPVPRGADARGLRDLKLTPGTVDHLRLLGIGYVDQLTSIDPLDLVRPGQLNSAEGEAIVDALRLRFCPDELMDVVPTEDEPKGEEPAAE